MRIPWTVTACLVLIGCAAQTIDSDPSQNETATLPAVTNDLRVGAAPLESDTPTAQSAREVSIESFAGIATCRRYVPTGSRIAGQRCASNEQTAADQVAQEYMRQDVDAMRRQQIYQEQARQQAMQEAMRRRTGQ